MLGQLGEAQDDQHRDQHMKRMLEAGQHESGKIDRPARAKPFGRKVVPRDQAVDNR